MIKHFTDLQVWRRAHRLFIDILQDVDGFPHSRGAEVVAGQILASVSSVSANIAEGFNRSQKRFVNCLDIALGEANETENWLYKMRDAQFLPEAAATKRLREVLEIQKMIRALKNKIAQNSDAVREDPPEYKIWQE